MINGLADEGLLYDDYYQLLACKECQIYIGSSISTIKFHFYYSRHQTKPKWGTITEVLQKLEFKSIPVSTLLDRPFQHVPLISGFKCSLCERQLFFSGKKTTMLEHMRKHHKQNGSSTFENHIVQLPLRGKKSIYYGIKGIKTVTQSSIIQSSGLLETLKGIVDNACQLSKPFEKEDLNYDFYVIGWQDFIEQNWKPELQTIDSDSEELLVPITRRLIELMDLQKEIISKRSRSIFLQNAVMDQENSTSKRPFLPLQEKRSWEEYATYFAKALIFMKSNSLSAACIIFAETQYM